jgi:hypothetical protein
MDKRLSILGPVEGRCAVTLRGQRKVAVFPALHSRPAHLNESVPLSAKLVSVTEKLKKFPQRFNDNAMAEC